MGVYRPLAIMLFFYEVFRVLFLAVILLMPLHEASANGILPVYISSNALFPLMALFFWLKPEEYGNYVTLYIAGKIIVLISFFAWQFLSLRDSMWIGFAARNGIIFGAYILLNLADVLSVWGAWIVKNKYRGGIR